MPGTPTLKGDNTVLFGSTGGYATGIITSATKRSGSEKLEIKDNNGYTVTVVYFDHKKQCEFEMIVQTAAPTLTQGDAVTIGGVANCLVDDTEEMWSNTDVRKFRVRATKYEGMTLA
jgi:DNA/RNA endonuclease YhcR with UshA esterase domain